MHAFGEFSAVLNFFGSFSENSARKKEKNKLRHHRVISVFPSSEQLPLNKFPAKSSVCLYSNRSLATTNHSARSIHYIV